MVQVWKYVRLLEKKSNKNKGTYHKYVNSLCWQKESDLIKGFYHKDSKSNKLSLYLKYKKSGH